MQTALETIATLSHEFGADDYVMGGGGNTSCKNEKTLWIKPSGTTLQALAPDRFIAMDRARLAGLYTLAAPPDAAAREALVKSVMEAAVLPATPGRASVEAPVHDSFQARFVVHTHPTLVNGVACSLGGAAFVRRRFPDALWLDYCDPGYTLSLHVREALADYRRRHGDREPQVMWLENHGIFVAGDTADDIRAAYAAVMETLQAFYKHLGLPTAPPPAPPPPAPETAAAAERVLRDTLGAEAAVVVAQGPVACAAGPVSPDHLVYAKSFVYEGLLTADAIQAFAARRGYLPRVFSTPDAIYACGATATTASRAMAFAVNAAWIRQLARACGGVQYLSDAARRFLENWEVESYRAKQS